MRCLKEMVTATTALDPAKLHSLTIEVYAARELETSDPELADVLFDVAYLARDR